MHTADGCWQQYTAKLGCYDTNNSAKVVPLLMRSCAFCHQQGLCSAAAVSPLEVSWSALRFRLDTEPTACAGLGTDSRELPSGDVLSAEAACSRQVVVGFVQGTEELHKAGREPQSLWHGSRQAVS